MLLGAIADDLTGATDLALTLTREGMRVVLVAGVPEPDARFGDAEAVVVALKSRTIAADEAVEQSLAAARVLLAAGAGQLFFKYCSTFDSTDRGNIGPVTEALMALLGETRSIACPAFPTNGRTVFRGHLFVGDVLLSESSMKDHPLTPMRDANLVRVLGRQTGLKVSLIPREVVAAGGERLDRAFAAIEGIAIVDAVDDQDLRAIGRAARDMKLVTGGSGVALGLPANFPGIAERLRIDAPVVPDAGGAVVLAGSCSVATRRQVEVAKAAGAPTFAIDPVALADGRQTLDQAVAFATKGGDGPAPVLYSSAGPEQVAAVKDRLGTEAGTIVEHFMGRLAAALAARGTTRFIVAGGETSGAVVAALGVKLLRIGPEIDPGVPWTVSLDGPKRLALALKSGNFGAPDFFAKAEGMVR